MSWRGFVAKVMYWPVRWLTRFEVIFDETISAETAADTGAQHVVYVMRSTSVTDLLVAQRALRDAGLPDPTDPLLINGTEHARVMYLEQAKADTSEAAIEEFLQLLKSHEKESKLNVQLVPLGLFWGRKAGQELREGNTMVADLDNPGRWRKFWLVVFSGRNILVRGSRPVSLRRMTDQHGSSRRIAHKLARVARVHFVRLRHAVAGPKVAHRDRVIKELLASAALQKAIADEVKSKKISPEKAHQRAYDYLDEIAAKYSDTLVRMLDRFMGWMWSRIYNGIHVEGGERIRGLAQAGHEVIYVPCHRSHMDYLLLSYVIYKEGLVPPHIAAGVNLDFFPAGPLFRRGGAFFIRRSFKGNKLYSAVFREYLNRLFQKGYPVEYFTEGGRSRTGRLLSPKTGMIAMTIQGMLRGQQRPMSIVPVYIGYEHVMEVGTYLKELKGKSKEKESVWKVISSLRHLRNFGQGFVTFGAPINVGQTLDKLTPNWRDSITHGAEEPERPKWLTPTVNLVAEQIMQRINDAAGMNSVNLSALALLSAEHHTLSREELVAQLDVYTKLLRDVPYSKDAYVPAESGEELWQLAKRHDKFTVVADTMGEMIRLDGTSAIAMTYYRNNIMHMVIVPAIVAAFACAHHRFEVADVVKLLEQVQPLLKEELFISHTREDMKLWTQAIVDHMQTEGMLTETEDGSYATTARDSSAYFKLELLARAAGETLQRYAILFELLQQGGPESRAQLEQASVELAERLSAMHGVNAPEFFDKKLLSALISTLKRQDLIEVNSEGNFVAHADVGELSDTIDRLLEPAVVQTIRQSVQRRLQD
ncbi:glycerol-3-phosphate 1-O-acyltransferase PlsB [Pseudidiomarina sp. 1APR75-33.1]|uniref:glycerol-3-phosphate 1-O-acyltransferase PlsB n=1 Tax=Pseudidiomarina terrestris TaxID=2820060 RepID=UPI00264D0396|nr:glycerol-3-phosphate 1-O-acyltransferase PlsB [Pseudidiomarina sp. 1APR75-33.1]MDN7126193.1 glycerol-3-phosphate 1-O-acyltransferase PlsB [Pseudidiomarina sp. 1APR75-33.1]